jgi:energy-converting hydrogenase Eha subunit H
MLPVPRALSGIHISDLASSSKGLTAVGVGETYRSGSIAVISHVPISGGYANFSAKAGPSSTTDLNSVTRVPSGVVLIYAAGLNNSGHIIAVAKSANRFLPALLSPTP